jgi:triacylglycerol lipase
VLVIVHGVGGHKEDWLGVMAAPSPKRTVYAVDMLGFALFATELESLRHSALTIVGYRDSARHFGAWVAGASSRDFADLSIPAQARAIKALLDRESVAQADLIGNSVSGWVSATFAATYPAMVRKLAVVDPAGFAKMFEGEPPVNLFPDDVDQMKKLLSFVLHSDFAHTDAFARFQASGEKTIVPRLYPALLSSPKLEDVMPKIKAPTLVVWGKEDRLFSVALAPYITGLVPGGQSKVIEKASHFPSEGRHNGVVVCWWRRTRSLLRAASRARPP